MKRGKVNFIFCFLAIILITSFVSASWFSDTWNKLTGKVIAGDANAALVAYYSFDGNTNEQVNNLPSTSSNIKYASGKNQGALSFNGVNSSFVVSDSLSLRTKEYTLSFWMKPSATGYSGPAPWAGIIGKPGRNYNIWYNYLLNSTYHGFCDGASATSNIITDANSINTDQWNYVVITNNGTDAKTYINGELKGSKTVVGELCVNATKLMMGKNLDLEDGTNYYSGLIDEVKLYNYALNETQISEEKNRATCIDSDALSASNLFNGTNPLVYGSTTVTIGSNVMQKNDECFTALGYNLDGTPAGGQITTACSGSNCYVKEAICRVVGNSYDADATEYIKCSQGCASGVCISSAQLVAKFSFEDNVNDEMGNAINGESHNISFVAGKVGKAARFNGTSFINYSDAVGLRIKNYTVSVWIKPNSSNNQWNGIIGKPGRNFNIWYNDGAKFIRQDFCDSSGGISTSYITSSVNSIKVNEWNYVVITNDGVTAKNYINGVLVNQSTVNGSLCSPAETQLIIGRNLGGNIANNYSGLIDELKIYNYAMTQEQISSEYSPSECVPNWVCEITPATCPQNGAQEKRCIDTACNSAPKTEPITCYPGLCSGCYIPLWLNSAETDTCYEKGSRLAQNAKLTARITTLMNNANENLSIISATEAKLILTDKTGNSITYNLVKDQVTEVTMPSWSSEINKFNLTLKTVVADTISVEVQMKGRAANDKVNLYCGNSGTINKQLVGNVTGCQENFECESNSCSEGQCIQLKDIATAGKEYSGFRVTFLRIICKLANLFSLDNYAQCKLNFGV